MIGWTLVEFFCATVLTGAAALKHPKLSVATKLVKIMVILAKSLAISLFMTSTILRFQTGGML